MEDTAMPNWDRYCTICGTAGSYLDFSPPYGDPSTQSCLRYPDDGCSSTVTWLDDDEDLTGEASSVQGTESSSGSY
jgi:hypothetical protein